MTSDTVIGAGGLHSDWAVWAGGKTVPAYEDAAGGGEAKQLSRVAGDATDLALKARYELLERENEFLRQRLSIADKQVEVKDSQINDFKAITENLTRQNQVLLMLAQGVPMERIMNGGRQEIEVQPRRASAAGANAGRIGGGGKTNDALREKIASRLRELTSQGMTQSRIAEALNEKGVPTLSGVGKWDRKKVSKFIRKTGTVKKIIS